MRMSGGLPLEKRTILLDALTALAKGDVLLVAKRDRLSRGDMMTTAMIEAAVKRAGARIVSAAGEGTESDDPASVLMRRIVDAFGEYERLLIKARTRAALKAKKARGERYGQVPYGRRLAGDGIRLEPDPAEASTVALIVELRAARTFVAGDRRGARSAEDPHQGRSSLESLAPSTTCSGGSPPMARARRKAAKTISEQLREAIGKSDLSAYELAEAAGVDRSVLSRFLNGRRSITLETLDRLADVLKLRLEGR